MKKMMKTSLVMALAALLAVGCQKDSTHTPEEGQLTTVTATINTNNLGRVAYEDDGTSVLKVDWKESGEAFWVMGAGLERFEQVPGTSTFTGKLNGGISDDNIYRAVYPITYMDEFGNIKMDYTQQSGKLDEKFNHMETETRTNGTHFEFQQMNAIIKPTFKVAGNNNVNKQISEITLLDVTVAKPSIKADITITCDQLETIYIYLPQGPATFDNPTILAAGESIALTATIGGEEYTGRITVPAGRAIKMGKVYPLGITLTKRPEVCNVPTWRYFSFTSIASDVKYIKFVANSNINTKDLQEKFTGAYLYKNGDVYEFHTAAKKFVLPESCYEMFKGNIYGIDFNNSVDTSKVKYMQNMFHSCMFTSIDLSCFDTSSLISTSGMFWSCTELKSIDLSNFVGANVNDMQDMFNGCWDLELIDLRNFKGAQTIEFSYFMNDVGRYASVDKTEVIVNSTFYNKFERYSGYTGTASKRKFTIVY